MNQKKVLQVVRHAKSSWDYEGIADIDRTLKLKGIQNAYEISRKIKMNNLIPDLMVSSPANRALHTAIIFARIFGFPLDQFRISDILYESQASRIIEFIQNFPDELNSIMIFGHNPDFTDLVNHFVKKPLESIPTSGAVTLTFKSKSWKDIGSNKLEKQLFFFPTKEE